MSFKKTIDIALYVFAYVLILLTTLSFSYYATVYTMNILPLTRYLLKDSVRNNSSNAVRNLLISHVLSATPQSRIPFRFLFVPVSLSFILLRRSIPPIDSFCHGVGNFINTLLGREPNRVITDNNPADITLPSISRFEDEMNNWSVTNNDQLNQRLNLNTLNLFGCLIFVLLFVIYFFIFSSLALYSLQNFSKGLDNLEKIINIAIYPQEKSDKFLNSQKAQADIVSSVDENKEKQSLTNNNFLQY